MSDCNVSYPLSASSADTSNISDAFMGSDSKRRTSFSRGTPSPRTTIWRTARSRTDMQTNLDVSSQPPNNVLCSSSGSPGQRLPDGRRMPTSPRPLEFTRTDSLGGITSGLSSFAVIREITGSDRGDAPSICDTVNSDTERQTDENLPGSVDEESQR
eukprot:735836_1